MKRQKHATAGRGGVSPRKKSAAASRAATSGSIVKQSVWWFGAGVAVMFAFAVILFLSLVTDDRLETESEVQTDSALPPASISSGHVEKRSAPANQSVHDAVAALGGMDLSGPLQENTSAAQSPADSATASSSNMVRKNSGDEVGDFKITYRSGVVDRALFEDGKVGVSDPVLLKLSEIFGWDIDFALDMQEGDHFLVIYEERYRLDQKTTTILAAQFVNRGKAYRAIGFPAEDGKIAYFTPSGQRLQRTFLRTPVQLSSVSSPFSKSRYHPILNMWRAHTGVDYAAAAGAPVRATASGRVESIGWNGGYGKTVVLKHQGAYSTLYAHLARYRQGLEVGAHVQQGDVIGYVGQSGLATGPHLHYEFRVNGEHRDPLAFRPRQAEGETIASHLQEEFFRVARARTARLNLLSGRQVAAQ